MCDVRRPPERPRLPMIDGDPVLDRTNQISTAVGVQRLARGEPFMPVRHVPARDGRPSRLIWLDVRAVPFSRPFLGEDIKAIEPSRTWFVTATGSIDRVPATRIAAVPVRGVIFHVARCGSTLARRLLGEVDGHLVLSEPGVLNAALVDERTEMIGPLIRAVMAAGAGGFTRGYIKTTTWNVLHAAQILDALDQPPAIFLHREPGAVLASLYRSNADRGSIASPTSGPASRHAPHEQNARYLEAMMSAALELSRAGRLRCVSYDHLVERFIDGDLPSHLGFPIDDALKSRMRRCAVEYSKAPDREFESDASAKAALVDRNPWLRDWQRRLRPLHEALVGVSQ